MKVLVLTAGAALLLMAAPALAQTATDPTLMSGPSKQPYECFVSGTNSGRCAQTPGLVDKSGEFVNPANLEQQVAMAAKLDTLIAQTVPNALSTSLVTLTASTAANGSSGWLTNSYYRGVYCYVETTAISGGSYTVNIQTRTPAGTPVNLMATPAISGTGVTTFQVYPGLTGSANVKLDSVLPYEWRISYANSLATITASISCSLQR